MSKKTLLILLTIIISGFVLTGCQARKKSLVKPPVKQESVGDIDNQPVDKDQKVIDSLNRDLDDIDNLEKDVAETDLNTTIDFESSLDQDSNQLPVASDNKIEVTEDDIDSNIKNVDDVDKLDSELGEESLDMDLGLPVK